MLALNLDVSANTENISFKPTNSEINDKLFRLYSELKCPIKHHDNTIKYPYSYCINKLYYDVENNWVVFDYSVFSSYTNLLNDGKHSQDKDKLKSLIEYIGFEIGIDVLGKSKSGVHGVLDRFSMSNINNLAFQELSKWRGFIRDRAVINLTYVDKNKAWHQAANDLEYNYFYSDSRRPKRLKDLINKTK